MQQQKMDWTLFGWAGIQLEIPKNWELSGLSGDERNGYLRLDDDQMPRLEIKWAQTRRKKPDLHATLDEYFKLIRKTYKKGTDLAFRRNVTLIKEPEFLEDCTVLGFSWKGSIRANGLIFYTHSQRNGENLSRGRKLMLKLRRQKKRIIIVQVMGRLKENWRPTVLRIFQSIAERIDTQNTLWSAYGLQMTVPKEYKLERQKLLSGYLLFSFVAKRAPSFVRSAGKANAQSAARLMPERQRLSIERYGPAELVLSDYTAEPRPLEAWFRTKYAKAIRGYGFEVIPHTGTDDERLTLIGQETRFYDGVPLTPVLALDKLSKRTTLAFHLWHCHLANRIYVIQAIGKTDVMHVAQQVALSIQCH